MTTTVVDDPTHPELTPESAVAPPVRPGDVARRRLIRLLYGPITTPGDIDVLLGVSAGAATELWDLLDAPGEPGLEPIEDAEDEPESGAAR